MKSKSGFTIIELLVVITVIIVLTTIAAGAYSKIQREGRDSKRKADITMLANLFEKYYEKNGEYPTGCSKEPQSTSGDCVLSPTGPNPTTGTDAIYADTTLAQIRAIFPELPEDFGDPSRVGDNPFEGHPRGDNTPNYFFLGQQQASGSSNYFPVMTTASSEVEIACGATQVGIRSILGGGSLSTFVLGYFSEADEKWHIYQGRQGTELYQIVTTPPTVRGTTVGSCVFEQ